jgi:hypothetical protein
MPGAQRHGAAYNNGLARLPAMASTNRPGKDFSFYDLPSGAYSRDVRLFLIPNY